MSLIAKVCQAVTNAVGGSKEVTPILGLDLGQAQDPSAFCGLQQTVGADGQNRYACRYLKRYPLGTPYTAIVADVIRIAQRFPKSASLAVDMTGVGRPVVDMLRAGLPIPLWPITITAGLQSSQDEDGWKVPKRELVSVIQILLQSGRLEIAKRLREASVLAKELANFHVKITLAGHEQFGAWREGTHDDAVLVLALSAWVGERLAVDPKCLPRAGGRSLMSKLAGRDGIFASANRPKDARFFGGRTPAANSRDDLDW